MKHDAFRARQRHVRLDGLGPLELKVAYTDVGTGEPILLLHGIPTWSYLFHDVIDRLADGHRVIAPDFLGHGYSDRRDRFDRSLVAQAAMIVRLLDELGVERATIVGHDTGGGVGLILAIEQPRRVSRLILSNIVAYDSWPAGDMIALSDPMWREKSSDEVADFVAAGYPEGLSHRERLTDEFLAGITAPYRDEEGKISLIRNASALNTNHTMALVDRHREIVAPTLMLWGADDPWQTIADARRLARDIPGGRVHELDASHWVPQDVPDAFADGIAAFMRETGVTSA
jgi:pimeloyl-ACP methyl ester carboxylesterase